MPYNLDVNFNSERTSSLTDNTNFITPSRFRLVIDSLKYPNTQFFVTNVQSPDLTVTGAPLVGRQVNVTAMPDKVEYGQLTITFLVDENLLNYKEMHDWIFGLVTQVDKDRQKARDLNLIILNSNNNPVEEIKFVDSYPTVLSGLTFDVAAADATFLTATVSFNFSYFKFV